MANTALSLTVWWLIIQALGLLALPLTTQLLRTLPDRGYAFSKALGLLITSYGVWLIGHSHTIPVGVPLIIAVALLMGIVGGGLSYRHMRHTPPNTNNTSSSLLQAAIRYGKHHWHAILFYEAVFLLALLAMVWVRTTNPAPWDSERPMDFAFFNALQRSTTYPPPDPWLSGYHLNYYYFGYLMMALVAKVSHLDAVVCYNLSMSLIFALTALHIAGVLANMIMLTPSSAPTSLATPSSQIPFFQRATPIQTAIRGGVIMLGVVLVLIAGNQAGALQWIVGNPRVVTLTGGELVSALRQALADKPTIELDQMVDARIFGTFQVLEREDQTTMFNPWWASRLVWDRLIERQGWRLESITEFPYFSFWLGDMHPHVMALPFALLAMALALATLARGQPPTLRSGLDWLDVVLTALVIGSLYMINSWDMPTYTLLYGGAFVLMYIHYQQHHPREKMAWVSSLAYIGLLGLGMVLFLQPFTSTFESFAGENEPLTKLPLLAGLSKIIALYQTYHATRVGVYTFLLIFGLFAIPLFVLVGFQRIPTSTTPLCNWFLWLLTPLLLIIGVLAGFPLLVLVGVGMAAVFLAWHRKETPVIAFVLWVVALGCALCVVPDLVYIRDTYNYRLNTIFKFYYQVWLLWGTLASYAVWWLLTIGTQAPPSTAQQQPTPTIASPLRGRRLRVGVVTGVVIGFAVFLTGALVYPIVTLHAMIQGETMINGPLVGLKDKDFPRGNGLHAPGSPRELQPAEAAAIAWLRQHAPVDSVVLEAAAGPELSGDVRLSGYSGVAISTGIPTVLGWYRHESLWRSRHPNILADMDERIVNVDRIYRTTNTAEARELLDKYHVTYVYVGEIERGLYPAAGLAKFATLGQVVVDHAGVAVYAVGE